MARHRVGETDNDNVSITRDYHERTKHSEISVRTSPHFLDWDNRPFPFKVYESLPSSPLPRDFALPVADALQSVSSIRAPARNSEAGTRELAELLFFSAGLTRKLNYGGETLYMRAASATGALYPIELYIVCRDIDALSAGVYHFNPLEFALVRLREGDHRAALAASSESSIQTAAMTIVLTSLAWRNAWKYGARSYRHWFWDSGVIVANLLSVAHAVGLEARVLIGFVDSEVDALLGLEEGKEATVLLVALGAGVHKPEPATTKKLKRISPRSNPPSRSEVDYPEIWRMNRASSLSSPAQVASWTSVEYAGARKDSPGGPVFPLESSNRQAASGAKLGEAILRRGSTRRFAMSPVGFSQLSAILRASRAEIPLDCLPAGGSLLDFYLIANHVEGLPQGSYFFDSDVEALVQLRRGELRRTAAYLCLEQPLFGSASAVFFLMTPLDEVIGAYGNRGYRVAQLEGGVRAGKIYLSAYALGFGASGSTFYDDAVTEFFSPHAASKACVIAVGVGFPAYRARAGRVLPQFS